MSKPIKILLVILAIAIIGYGAYLLFSSGQASDSSVTSSGGSTLSQEENLTNKQFLELLRSLKDVHIADNDLFKNPAFTSLADFSVDLKPEKAGRENPFAPLTDVKGNAAAAAGTAPADVPRGGTRTQTKTKAVTPADEALVDDLPADESF